MLREIENYCKTKKIRFGYGRSEGAAEDFFDLGGGVFVVVDRPRVGKTEGVVMLRGEAVQYSQEIRELMRSHGDVRTESLNRLAYTERIRRPYESGGAGIGHAPTPPIPAEPTVANFHIVELGTNTVKLAGDIINPDGVEITVKYASIYKDGELLYGVESTEEGFEVLFEGLDQDTEYSVVGYLEYDGGGWASEPVVFTTSHAAQQPTVTTFAASNVTSHSAMFYAEISNPDGVAITAKGFKYHKGSGAWTYVPVTGEVLRTEVDGLDADSNYSYRAYVVTDGGEVLGEIVAFHTEQQSEREIPFYFESTQSQSPYTGAKFLRSMNMDAREFEYSVDNITWIEFPHFEEEDGYYVSEFNTGGGNLRLYLRNKSATIVKLSYSINKFHELYAYDDPCTCGGNILSLLTKNFANVETVGSGCFVKIGLGNVVNAPKFFFNNAPENVFVDAFAGTAHWNYPGFTEIELPAEVVEAGAYKRMFYNNSKINRIVLRARVINGDSLQQWLQYAEDHQTQGTIVCYPELQLPSGASGIPTSWTREDLVD